MTNKYSFKNHVLFLSVALAVASAPLMMTDNIEGFFIDEAVAFDGTGHKGSGQKSGTGKGAMRDNSGKGMHRGRPSVSQILSVDKNDEDSHLPEWDGVPGRESRTGNNSSDVITQKGQADYGDMVVMLRNDDGSLVVHGNTTYAVAPDGSLIPIVNGKIPEDADVQTVEYGRLNIARVSSKVLDRSLVEALSKLDGRELFVNVTRDPAGRLIVDGDTIHSPLENLALYTALLTTKAVNGVITLTASTSLDGADATYTFILPESVRLDLAASALAAASDKSGELTIDVVAGVSDFVSVADELASYLPDYSYDRQTTYDGVMVDILAETSPGVWSLKTVNLYDVVEWNTVQDNSIKNNLEGGIDVYTQAADDAVQALEFVHDNEEE